MTINNSQQQSNIMNDLLNSFSKEIDHEQFKQQITSIDNKLSKMYSYYHYSPSELYSELYQPKENKSVLLGIPKNHSLTDSFLRTTLGCQQKLAKSYIEIVQQPDKKQQQQKQKRIESAKKKFAQSNSFKDYCANSKQHIITNNSLNLRPIVENQHQTYLQTQLAFFDYPKNDEKNKQKNRNKNVQNVTKKIKQLGGMEDTLGRMEQSLNTNQINNCKKKSILSQKTSINPFSTNKTLFTQITNSANKSWLQRSKNMRQQFNNKFNLK